MASSSRSLVHLVLGFVGWNHRIIHGDSAASFRTAQTALNCYWMLGHQYRVAYETPVFGPPWSMPYEFPLYEWIVAAVVTMSGWPLDQTGRAVVQGFFLLCLWPCWSLLGRLGVAPRLRVCPLVLLLLSPFYVYWSRAFLIESTALFLALAYLALAWLYLDRPRASTLLLALLLGVLAALVKITTCAGAWLVLGLLLPRVLRLPEFSCLSRPSARLRMRTWRVCTWLLIVGVPLAAGVLWTHYADGLKEQNPIAKHLTSRALQEWNFGLWGMRWEWDTWKCILCRTWTMTAQSAFLGASLLLALLARRRLAQVVICAFVYLCLPFVFTNLYCFHEYYAYASMIFLLGAVALALAGLSECGGWRAWLGGLTVAVFLVVAGYGYHLDYYPDQAFNQLGSAGICQKVQENTGPDEVIVVLGCDWASEVPYYCRRRALMLPFWPTTPVEDLPMHLERLSGYRVAALVVYRPWFPDDQVGNVLRDLHERQMVSDLCYQDPDYSLYVLRPAENALP